MVRMPTGVSVLHIRVPALSFIPDSWEKQVGPGAQWIEFLALGSGHRSCPGYCK